MNDKNRNLLVRIVSALVLLPVVLFLLVKGGLGFTLLGGVVGAICASEYYGIVFKKLGPSAWAGVLVAGIMPLLPYLSSFEKGFTHAFWLISAYAMCSWAYHLIRGPLDDAPTRVAHLVNGVVLAGVGLTALIALRLLPDGIAWVIAALVMTWGQDTAAYFFGRFLGKRKLYPAVSPNKTVEGFIGGFVGAMGGLFIARAFFYPQFTVLDCVLLGIVGGLVGPVGDLSESMLKRAYGVKDSGKIIPGHGGLLDRADALLFNAPVLFAYVTFLRDFL